MKYPRERHGEKPVQAQIEDIIKEVDANGMQRLMRFVCYNIARHRDPTRLTDEEGRRFVFKMKKMNSAKYLQKKLKP